MSQAMDPSKSRTVIVLFVSLLVTIAVAILLGYDLLSVQQTVSSLQLTISQESDEISRLTADIHSLKGQISALTEEALQNHSSASSTNLAQLYSQVVDSVVEVQGVTVQTIRTFFGTYTQYALVQGSGFVYNETGRIVIVTNFHVIDQAKNITVTMSDGDAFDATVLGTDVYSDLAVLSVSTHGIELTPIKLGDSSDLQVGDLVVAVGNPFGELLGTGTMTMGIVSGLGRTIQETTTGGFAIANVIQTDAPINSGNSGGPLLNSLGEVVGITTAIVSGTQNIGLAIPSETILKELPDLVARGTYDKHSWIGINGVDVTPTIAKTLNLNKTYGRLVVSVTPGGPAEKAGIKGGTRQVQILGTPVTAGGDVIIAINGTRIRDGDDLSSYLEAQTLPGEMIQVTILRDNVEQTISLVLGKITSSAS